ncbi:MAG: amino acid ABC transporter substrate-binding protein [Alphaproteobacteria bacterium]|nr:amino acid ABC transporter substrate-binding protein [Alphaproteobacteria bacterium]
MFSKTIRRLGIAAAAIMAVSLAVPAHAQGVLKVGASAPKSGPLAGGAAVTHWPNIRLWVEQVNARGGLQLDDGRYMLELIEYDDGTNPGNAIANHERMATQDKVDIMLAPYGTGFNLATAAIFDKYGFPQLTSTAITDQVAELTAQYPGMFFTLGDTSTFSRGPIDILVAKREAGEIGNRVAMVNVADAFGIELANAARDDLKEAGFEIVYDTSYPLGTQDLAPVIKGAQDSNPDAFLAWSYPPDTFGLTEQAQIANFNVDVFYTAVATAFPAFGGRFGAATEGILGAGGINPDTEEMQAYIAAHTESQGQPPDAWASGMVYATLQILETAIEAVGSIDNAAIIRYIDQNPFETVMGPIRFNNQNNQDFWTVGQWQNGIFYGVNSKGRAGSISIIPKQDW